MLVLTRTEAKSEIRIGPDIIVKVLLIKPGSVAIGIEAPPGVLILREEVAARNPSHEGEK